MSHCEAACGPLCPDHGDGRDTSIAPSLDDEVDYTPGVEDYDCATCQHADLEANLGCCIERNGCEPWAHQAPSALVTEADGERCIMQLIHEGGRTFVSVAGKRWTPGNQWGNKGYWTDSGQHAIEQKASTLPAFLGGGEGPAPYELHATGVCEKCTQQWRRQRDATSRAR